MNLGGLFNSDNGKTHRDFLAKKPCMRHFSVTLFFGNCMVLLFVCVHLLNFFVKF